MTRQRTREPQSARLTNGSLGKVVVATAAAVGALGVVHAQMIVPSLISHARDESNRRVHEHESRVDHLTRAEFDTYVQNAEKVQDARLAETEARILHAIDEVTEKLLRNQINRNK